MSTAFRSHFIMTCISLLLAATAANAAGPSSSDSEKKANTNKALRALGHAYQNAYEAQKKLPDNATPQQRETVTRRMFAYANKLAMQEAQRKQQDLIKAQSRFGKRFTEALKESAALDAKRKEAIAACKGDKACLAKIKGRTVAAAGSSGAKNAPGPAAKAATPIGGAEGARDVHYGTEKNLKVIDGIIEE